MFCLAKCWEGKMIYQIQCNRVKFTAIWGQPCNHDTGARTYVLMLQAHVLMYSCYRRTYLCNHDTGARTYVLMLQAHVLMYSCYRRTYFCNHDTGARTYVGATMYNTYLSRDGSLVFIFCILFWSKMNFPVLSNLCWDFMMNFESTRTHTSTHARTHTRTHTSTHTHARTHTRTHTSTLTHARTHLYVHKRTHMHTSTRSNEGAQSLGCVNLLLYLCLKIHRSSLENQRNLKSRIRNLVFVLYFSGVIRCAVVWSYGVCGKRKVDCLWWYGVLLCGRMVVCGKRKVDCLWCDTVCCCVVVWSCVVKGKSIVYGVIRCAVGWSYGRVW